LLDSSTETSEAAPGVSSALHDVSRSVSAAEAFDSGTSKECCPIASRLKTGEKKSHVGSAVVAQ
jgi:hypothetical protein